MGTYTRPSKSVSGDSTTSYVDGNKLPASELNADFDNIVTLLNGNIDSENISSSASIPGSAIANSADIDPSKIGDYSASAAEMATTTSPGDSASPSLATNLEEEIARIRYAIRAAKAGHVGTVYEDGGTETAASWTEPAVVGPNLLVNGGFNDHSVVSGDVPVGWTELNTISGATSIGGPDSNYVGYGVDKKYFQFAGDQTDGISQVVSGLKGNTKYMVGCVYSLVAGGVQISTANAVGISTTDYTDLTNNNSSPSSTTANVFNGILKTDASGSDVTFNVSMLLNSSTIRVLYAWFFELNDTIPSLVESIPTQTATANSEVTNLPSTVASGTDWNTQWTDISTLALSQYIPNPGYRLIYEVEIAWAAVLNTRAYFFAFRLEMNDGSDSYPDGPLIMSADEADNEVNGSGTVRLTHVVDNATPGATYVFTPQVTAADSASGTLNAPRLHPLIAVTYTGAPSAGSNSAIQTASRARLRAEKI